MIYHLQPFKRLKIHPKKKKIRVYLTEPSGTFGTYRVTAKGY
jgi:hypothetical protein